MFFREGLFVFIFLHDFSFWQILGFHKCALHIQELCNSIIWYFMDRQTNVNFNSLEYSKWVQCCFKHVFIFNLRQQLYFLNESKLKWGDDNCSIYDTFDLNYLKARMSWYIRKNTSYVFCSGHWLQLYILGYRYSFLQNTQRLEIQGTVCCRNIAYSRKCCLSNKRQLCQTFHYYIITLITLHHLCQIISTFEIYI